MTEEGDIPEGDDVLAAEYALGLLSDADRAAFEERLDGDGALRARVAFWQEHFAGLADDIPAVAPPQAVWRRIAGALPRATPAPAAPPAAAGRVWRWLAGMATAAAIAVVALLMFAPEQPEAPLFAGEVRAEDASQRFVVAYDAATGTLRIARAAGGAGTGRSLQLWAIHDGEAPASLAVLPEDERFEVVVPEPLRPRLAEATLAISDEPLGGSPGDQPTGPVVAVGSITRL